MRGSLPSFTRRRHPGELSEPGRGSTAASRHVVPLGFDAVGDALTSGRCPIAACALVGTGAGRRRCVRGRGAGRAAGDLRGSPRLGPRLRRRRGAERGLERGDARVPRRRHVRGPAHRARQPAAPAQPARGGLPRRGACRGRRTPHARARRGRHLGQRPTSPRGPARCRARSTCGWSAPSSWPRSPRGCAPPSRARRPSPAWGTTPWRLWCDARRTWGSRWRRRGSLLVDLGVPPDARIWIEGLPGRRGPAGDLLGTLLATPDLPRRGCDPRHTGVQSRGRCQVGVQLLLSCKARCSRGTQRAGG